MAVFAVLVLELEAEPKGFWPVPSDPALVLVLVLVWEFDPDVDAVPIDWPDVTAEPDESLELVLALLLFGGGLESPVPVAVFNSTLPVPD